ncbi:CAJ1 [Candida theae]|uniref:CAJ1 n=1 Tax=Candida theae TaxID=1198502 RepID=A0AAD5BEY2_9ASCO|nr:CAJ1 [Candida theae]KAI5958591.1 CAJ1 [Candida theae]
MVVDTTYYDILGVEPTANEQELRKAYRKQAIKLHPDKNGNDPKAAEKFQDLGEAYGILSNADSRKVYDEYGVEGMKEKNVQGQDIDPSEFFEVIFGGVAFKDWIGELGMFNDITKSAEVFDLDEDNSGSDVASSGGETVVSGKADGGGGSGSGSGSGASPVSAGVSHGESSKSSTHLQLHSHEHKGELSSDELKRKKKQKLTKEQREEILRIQEEAREAKLKRIQDLSVILKERLDNYRAAVMNKEGLQHFTTKLKQELDDMKIESFGIQLLHLIGKIYTNQANATLKAAKSFGITKIYTSVKSSTETVKNGYSIIKSALDTQETMEKVMKEQEAFQLKQEQGYTPTQEEMFQQAERERFVTGKFLATAWSLVKFEVTNVLNKVCQTVLNEKGIGKKEKVARANALLYIGTQLLNEQRSADEDEEARIFEEMMADAKMKKANKKKQHTFF